MAEVVQSIGATGRDFSTITLWAADHDDDPTYDSGDTSVGECYDDDDFDEAFDIDGGGTIGLTKITLRAAVGEEPFGIEAGGVRMLMTSAHVLACASDLSSGVLISQIEFDANGNNSNYCFLVNGGGGQIFNCHALMWHGASGANSTPHSLHGAANRLFDVTNCFIYDLTQTAGSSQACGGITTSTSLRDVFNNTIHDIVNNNGTGTAFGIWYNDNAASLYRNNICTDPSGTSSGAKECYRGGTPASASADYNIASDATADGANSHDSESSSALFESNADPYDLHLVAGATNAIGGGNDEGTDVNLREFDINGRDRDAEGDTWDIGAHQFVSAVLAGGRFPPFGLQVTGRRHTRRRVRR